MISLNFLKKPIKIKNKSKGVNNNKKNNQLSKNCFNTLRCQ